MATDSIDTVERRTFIRRYPGERGQARLVRAALALLLDGCPRADDAVLIASELAANAGVHSNSAAPGGQFTVRAEVYCGDYVWIEVEDQGGPWIRGENHDGYVHGLALVDAVVGTGNWGIDGDAERGRIVWARLDWPED
jgi:serine/threonine-protein kinase RsbW